MTVYGVDVVAAASTQLWKPYALAGCRCSHICYSRDCSGLCVFAINECGYAPSLPCATSFWFARWCRDHNTVVTKEEALWTPGALAIAGPNGGEGPSRRSNGSDGHIAICVGNGRDTIEARGRRYGVCVADGRRSMFIRYALIPGVNHGKKGRGDVLLFVCPNKPVRGDQSPHAVFYPAGTHDSYPNGVILMRNGASIANDRPTGDTNVRVITPQSGKWVSCTARDDRGLMVVNDAGKTSPPGSLAWS